MGPSQKGPAALFIGVELSSVYVDLGASCADKNRAHQVWTTGDVVNLHKPGKYAVKYECTTISGEKAMSAIREVNVIQHPSYKQLSKNGPGNETPGPPTCQRAPSLCAADVQKLLHEVTETLLQSKSTKTNLEYPFWQHFYDKLNAKYHPAASTMAPAASAVSVAHSEGKHPVPAAQHGETQASPSSSCVQKDLNKLCEFWTSKGQCKGKQER
jgi:hypothetical protein